MMRHVNVTAIKWTRAAAAAGGVGFAGFWFGSLLKVEVVPWPVALLWHATVAVLLTVGAIGAQRSSDGPALQRLLGWIGVALLAAGQAFSLEIIMLGFLIFGVAVTMGSRLPRTAGALMALGAVGFLVAAAINGPFWGDPNPSPAGLAGVAFAASLMLIALGWMILGVSRRVELPTAGAA
jgi:hypothetical protein